MEEKKEVTCGNCFFCRGDVLGEFYSCTKIEKVINADCYKEEVCVNFIDYWNIFDMVAS